MRPWDNVAWRMRSPALTLGTLRVSLPRQRRPARGQQPASILVQEPGTLWLDDVELVETTRARNGFPKSPRWPENFVPNSSFECGRANWGSFTYGLSGWLGTSIAWKVSWTEPSPNTAVKAEDRAHAGNAAGVLVRLLRTRPSTGPPSARGKPRLVRVKSGEALTLSAFLRADADGPSPTGGQPGADTVAPQSVTVGTQWRRYEFTFTPTEPFLFIAVGSIWSFAALLGHVVGDAIQLERGERASTYEPRQPFESFLEASVPGTSLPTSSGAQT